MRSPDTPFIVAIAACGPYWKWAVVTKKDVPKWDWETNRPKNDDDLVDFIALFDGPVFELSSKESDNELDKIKKQYVGKVFSACNPSPPPELLARAL